MKILYHHRTLGDGAEGIHINEMVYAFTRLGHEVLLTGPAVNKKNKRKNRLFQTVKKVVKGPAYELTELGYNLFGYINLSRLVSRFKPDFIYDRYMLFNLSVISVGKKYNIPVFTEVNAPLAFERSNEPDESQHFKTLAFELEKKICNSSFKTIAVSTSLKKYLVSMGVDEDKIFVLPNGVNLDKFKPVQKNRRLLNELKIHDDSFVIGFTGILRPWHGLDLLLNAFKKVHDRFSETVLLIAGDGPVKDEVISMAENLGISDSVFITGRVPHKKISEYISLFDVAVSPKTTFYASPMKIPEYMAMKKAVVAPDTENIRDILDNNKTGVCFKNGSSDSMADAIIMLMQNRELKKEIGNNAYQETLSRLNWLNNAEQIIKEFEKW